MTPIAQLIAEELEVRAEQVNAAVQLLDEGATVPFVARYRKEVTQGLDDTQLRKLEERLGYLRELDDRRESILKAIAEQGKLSDPLKAAIQATRTKTELEDLYLPYKKKRRTKAQIAREAGLEPLALGLLKDPGLEPEASAEAYLNPDKGFEDVKAALDGARQILMEQFAEDAELAGTLREWLWDKGMLSSRVVAGKEREGEKFADYFEYNEQICKIPSHRALALFRGRNEGVLNLDLDVAVEAGQRHPAEARIAARFGIGDEGRPADAWLLDTVRWTWKVKLHTRLDLDLKTRLREQAEEEAIRVFADNLNDLLLAAPAGPRATIGLDPGLRTGVKVAVVDATGKLLDTTTIYPHAPRNQWDESIQTLAVLAKKYQAELVSIGNGTASRETDRLAADLIKRHPDLRLNKIMVSEAGASVYSASELAANEFPDLDVSLRGAVSIARRLQDPLAELVKIEPKSIGVGQYQHDVSQVHLARSLDTVVVDCVNAVGVDLNMASAPLLARVSGLNQSLAQNIIEYRDTHGAFSNRKELLKVKRLGDKAYEQAAGFLRIMHGDNPLDASSVHPESYPIVDRIMLDSGRAIADIIGDRAYLKKLDPARFTDEHFGLPTVTDIIQELEKPGRDPRPEFKMAQFREGVETMQDLKPGMVLEGVVTNVTNFGAFVDVGVHQDGLVHISQLADRFVKDPREVVKAGDLVKVRVIEADVQRKRIALSMRSDEPATVAKQEKSVARDKPVRTDQKHRGSNRQSSQQGSGAMADALRKALGK
jgi:protein Tex